MVLSRPWTGRDATMLREALRLSVREFAAIAGAGVRTVARWSEPARLNARVRPFNAGLLDEVLRRADDDARTRFEQMAAGSAVVATSHNTQVPPLLEQCTVDPDLRQWIQMNRRELLQLFGGTAFGLSAVAAILGQLDADERRRVEHVLITPSRVDAIAIDDIETALRILLAQNDSYGPQAVLSMVAGQTAIAEALLRECPPALERRLYGLHGSLSQLAGWIRFDLQDYPAAARCYEDARKSAHRAHDDALAALVLCNLSYLEVWNGDPRVGIDHAVAAQNWARRGDDWRLRSYADDMAAYAYAADGQRNDTLAALDAADSIIAAAPANDGDAASVAYFQGPGLAASMRSDCLHQLGDGRRALASAEDALALINPAHVRNAALAYLDLANAYTDIGEIEASTAAITNCARLGSSCRSDRLIKRVREARTDLDKWSTATTVQTLDDELETYGFASTSRDLNALT